MGRLTAEVNHQFTHQYLVPGGRGKLRKLPADGVAFPSAGLWAQPWLTSLLPNGGSPAAGYRS